MTTSHFSSLSSQLGSRLLAGVGTLTLLAALGLLTSRPAHTAGGPIAVNVANTSLSVSDSEAAQTPFATRVFPHTGEGTATYFTVPAGKRLVIQQVSAFTQSSTAVDVEIQTVVSGNNSGLRVPFTVSRSGIYYGVEALTDYADAGTKVYFTVDDSQFPDNAGFNVDIKGYYVDVP